MTKGHTSRRAARLGDPSPASKMLVAGSTASGHLIARAPHNGGKVEPVGRPFAGTILFESSHASLEESSRTNTVPAGGMGEPDADLGETLPQVAFFDRPSLPAGFEYFMSREGSPTFHQTPGNGQRL